MSPSRFCFALSIVAILLLCSVSLQAQSEPNLEAGFKPYGSYQHDDFDSISLTSGGLILHIPSGVAYPQRGGRLNGGERLFLNSKGYSVQSFVNDNNVTISYWSSGPSWSPGQLASGNPLWPNLSRTYSTLSQGTVYSAGADGYVLTSGDGSQHPLGGATAVAGALQSLETEDASGWRLDLTTADSNNVPSSGFLHDRQGNQYPVSFGGGKCTVTTSTVGGSTTTRMTCQQPGGPVSITDGNGNLYTLVTGNGPGQDTMGRAPVFATESPSGPISSDTTGCATTGGLTLSGSSTFNYPGPNGTSNPVKLCYATLTLQTNFGVSGVDEYPNQWSGESGGNQASVVVMVINADGGKWALGYDSYGNVTSVSLPLGGSITYQWQTVSFPACSSTPVSRAVTQRALTDNNGHTYVWNYQWVTQQSNPTSQNGTYTNIVTDPLSNDTVHVFTNYGSCGFYETATQAYQGSHNSGTLLRQTNTAYTVIGSGEQPGQKYAVPSSIQSTVYPSGKVSLVTKSYDTGAGGQGPSFGKVLTEKDYDWGQGSPGALLRETDYSYEWQNNNAYLTAHILDLPASVIIKDGNGNRLAETDYTYDESQYLTASNISTQHGTPPNSVRGNLTTVSKWLNTSSNPVVSHTNWYDTGEAYQQIDPLGNATTHSYDPAYVGAYSTRTCNALSQCVSGTYDFTTGLLTTFTNANATQQASGNTPGDANHTTSYSYDFMSRLTTATLPPDPSNNGAQAHTSFQYPNPISLPFTVTKTHSITPSLSDSVTSTYDGLGRVYKTQHALPNGTAEVDTSYDGLDRVVSVTNPYFSTSDPTYGVVQTQYDALGRVTQTTKQDGSVSTVAYDYVPLQAAAGDCTKTTDEAGMQRLTCSDGLRRLIEVHEPGDSFNGTQAQGAFSVNGSLQTYIIPGANATYSTGSVTISGIDQDISIPAKTTCVNHVCTTTPAITLWDHGSVTITINGVPYSASYGSNGQSQSFVSGIASALQATINNNSSFVQVTGVSTGTNSATLSLQSRNAGGNVNFSLSASTSYDSTDFKQPSFTTSTSGTAMTGGTSGTSPTTVYDQGTVTASVGSFTARASYSQGGNSTAAQVAAALASALSASSSPVTASASGATINITYANVGTAGDVSVGCGASTSQTAYFSGPSFSCPSSTALSGGYNPEGPSLDFNYFVTQYSYDGLGNLLNVTQKGDPTVISSSQYRVRNFTYDSLSRLLTAANPESGQISYGYDANGNVLSKASPAPNQTGTTTQTVSYCYDALNRVTGRAYSAQSCPLSSPVVTYAYDVGTNGIGHLTSLSDQAGSGSYGYDALGRVASEQRTIAGVQKTLSYTYNLDSSVATLTYPSGAVITYTPDSGGRMLSAVDSGNNINYVTNATYGPDSSLTGFLSGSSSSFSGISNSWQYNQRLQICRITALTTGSLPASCTDTTQTGNVRDLGYNLNLGNGDNGNVIGITNYKDSSRSQSFTYDAMNRLTSAQNAGTNCSQKTAAGAGEYWGNSYSYDSWGNLLQKTVTKCSAENLSVTALANNQLSGYSYDAAGNMTYDATTGNNYSYDAENRLTGAAGYAYTYDADGNRVEKSTGSMGTIYWYMSLGVVSESDLSGNLQSEYVFFNGKRVARKDFPGGAVSYYFPDHLGTASVITSSAGTITGDEDFYAWGGEIHLVNNDSNHYKLTGQERDTETGLDYFGKRFYGNWLGRWANPDPAKLNLKHLLNPQKWNKYAYALNNPLRYVDPDGQEEIEVQFRAFIPQKTVSDPMGHTFSGDNRGFTSSQDVTSRTSITVRIETDASVRPGNPIISVTQPGTAGQTKMVDQNGNVVKSATQTQGLPTVTGSRDTNGNAVLNFQENAKNPLEPQSIAPGIRADLNVTVTQNGTSIDAAGTLSATPSFELNVGSTNVPLQSAPGSNLGFGLGLFENNPVQVATPLIPAPPPPTKDKSPQ